MAKNSVRDFDATAANNTDIQSVNIAEGCAPSGINNAIRELMADIKDVSAGTIALESPQADSLTVTGDLTVDTNTLFVDASENAVGIGTTTVTDAGVTITKSVTRAGSWDAKLALQSTGANDFPVLLFSNSTGNSYGGIVGTTDITGDVAANRTSVIQMRHSGSGGNLVFETNETIGTTTSTERMRIDNTGNAFLAKIAANSDNVGIELNANGHLVATRDGGAPFLINRKTDDGAIAIFRKDGTSVGSIGVSSAYSYIGDAFGNGGAGFHFVDVAIRPFNAKNASNSDNAIDLGTGTTRFDDIFATNGTIQTSDQNEKQQIASLTAAEITAAKAISALFKTFKWNDKVEAKGDAARTHTGVIAQDVQQAMTDAGLDATDYAFWCSNTWWETQTDVPAVEAVEAQDAVLDDDGNIVTEAVEAVEARDAYTRTDTYDTVEEAPEGATERTRLGIRYPELLAFVGAATEQRLADIETRLTALEA